MHNRCCWLLLLVCLFTAPAWASSADQWLEDGKRLWSKNQLEAAEQACRKAIAADPESSTAHARLGALMLALDPELENAQDLSRYLDARMATMNAAPEPAAHSPSETPE